MAFTRAPLVRYGRTTSNVAKSSEMIDQNLVKVLNNYFYAIE
jgi:hypothetical protein